MNKIPSCIMDQLGRDFIRLVIADNKITLIQLKRELESSVAGRWYLRHNSSFIHIFKLLLKSFRDANLIIKDEGEDFIVRSEGEALLQKEMERIYQTRISYIEEFTDREFTLNSLQ